MPDEQTDERLLVRARRGDEAAFLSLYERHHAPVFRFACRLLNDAATAEDVVHDCFLDLVRSREGDSAADFDAARGTLRNYLYGMARHRALKIFRRTARECELDDATRETRAGASHVESNEPLERLLDAELSEVVRRAVAMLPPLQRESLVLFEYEELSLTEIAEVVGVEVGTVKARLFRARRSLRKTLAPHSSPCGVEALAIKD
ncbi:MAG: polymerase sigma-70 factor, subfamily [Acidobacteriota bacterium]|nr:polymerase sigma-70 factor, subfamily [Acidobacteriota bacterium]